MSGPGRRKRQIAQRVARRGHRDATDGRWHNTRRWLLYVLSFLTPSRTFAFISLILIPLAAVYVTAADSDLVLLDPAKTMSARSDSAEVVTTQVTIIKDELGRAIASSALIALNLDFENRGLKAGHIENIELRTFPPSKAMTFEVHHVDHSVLRWREKKRLHFEFVGTTTKSGHQKYQVVFIDSERRQVAQMQQDLTLTFDSGCPTCP